MTRKEVKVEKTESHFWGERTRARQINKKTGNIEGEGNADGHDAGAADEAISKMQKDAAEKRANK